MLVRSLSDAISGRCRTAAGAAPSTRWSLADLLQAYVRDECCRLAVARRNHEYDHHYGLVLTSRPVRGARRRAGARRSRGPSRAAGEGGPRQRGGRRCARCSAPSARSAPDPVAGRPQPVRRPADDEPPGDADAAVAARPAGSRRFLGVGDLADPRALDGCSGRRRAPAGLGRHAGAAARRPGHRGRRSCSSIRFGGGRGRRRTRAARWARLWRGRSSVRGGLPRGGEAWTWGRARPRDSLDHAPYRARARRARRVSSAHLTGSATIGEAP